MVNSGAYRSLLPVADMAFLGRELCLRCKRGSEKHERQGFGTGACTVQIDRLERTELCTMVTHLYLSSMVRLSV
jgi:hypothetical protein